MRTLRCCLLVTAFILPAAGAFGQSGATVTLAWDPSPSTNIVSYNIYCGTVSQVYTNRLGVGNVTVATVSNLVAGITYYFAATAVDSYGLESDFSNEISYQPAMPQAGPVVTLNTPLSGSVYRAPATINLGADVTTNGNTINAVRFYNGSTLLREITNAPFAFSWSAVPAGSYSLSADVLYNGTGVTRSASALVTVTNPPPAIVLSSPLNGSKYTAPATVNFSATVTTNGNAISAVQFFNGTTLLRQVTASPFTFAWTPVSAGSYTLSAKVVYNGGSTVASSAALVTVTNPPPVIVLNSPASGSKYGAPATINLAAAVTTNGNTINGVQFFNGTTLLRQVTSSPFTFAWSSVSAGSYSVSAKVVYNGSGAVTSGSALVTVTNPPPNVVLSAPLDGSWLVAPATISVAANVVTNGNTINAVRFYNETNVIAELTNSPYTFSWGPLPAASYAVSVRVVYNGGSTVASAAARLGVTNPPPTIQLSAPADSDAFAAPAIIKLAAEVQTNGHSIQAVQFLNGSILLGQVASAPFVFNWVPVPAGTYSVSSRLLYDAGSVMPSPAVSILVTNPPPLIELTSPLAGSFFTAPGGIGLGASVTPNGHTVNGVKFYNGSTLLGQASTAPYNFVWENIGAGGYSLSAQVIYDEGASVMSGWSAITVTNLPSPWQTLDIARTGPPGNAATVGTNSWRVSGAGTIGGTNDQFRFLYKPLKGDGYIMAQLTSTDLATTNGSLGVMIRQDLTPGSPYAMMASLPSGTFLWQTRSLAQSPSVSTLPGASSTPLIGYFLRRIGNTFYAYKWDGGASWISVATVNLPMSSTVYIGLAVSASSDSVNVGQFEGVSIVP